MTIKTMQKMVAVFLTLFACLLLVNRAHAHDKTVLEDYLFLPDPGTKLKCNSISPELAQQFFNAFAADPNIPFEYPENGCFVRATQMSRILERYGIYTERIYVSSMEKRLWASTSWAPSGKVDWDWHTAPLVRITAKNGETHSFVIDPGVSNRPLRIEEWLNTIHAQNCKLRTSAHIAPAEVPTVLKELKGCLAIIRERFATSAIGYKSKESTWIFDYKEVKRQWDPEQLEEQKERLKKFLGLAQSRVFQKGLTGWKKMPIAYPGRISCAQ